MMQQFIVLIKVCLMASLLIEQTQAAPLPTEKLQNCLKIVDSKLDSIVVPDEIKNLADGLRSLNPTLKDLSLSKMVDDDSVILDAVASGIVPANKEGELVEICTKYVRGLLTIMNGTECGEELLVKTDSDYEGIMRGHSNLEQLIGYAKVCTTAF